MNHRDNSGLGFPEFAHLTGYEKITDHGFALPCFEQPGGNTVYVANAKISFDDVRHIWHFEPYQPEKFEPLVPGTARVAQVGDPWVDVFLWREHVHTGTAEEIWSSLEPYRAEIAQQASLSLLTLASAVPGVPTEALARGAFDWLERRFGTLKASRWRTNTYLRGIVIRTLHRLYGEEAHEARIRSAFQHVALQVYDRRLILYLPDLIAKKHGVEMSTLTTLRTAAQTFELEFVGIDVVKRIGYKMIRLSPTKTRSYEGIDSVSTAPLSKAELNQPRIRLSRRPNDKATRQQLAMGLVNTLNDAKAENALDRRDGLLDELRGLARDWPDDAAVRQRLAKGLFNTLIDAKAENALDRRDGLLDELRGLARDWPDDAAVRQLLAMGLFNTLNHAKAENALDRRDGLLDELRGLARDWPDDAAVRQPLAIGLVNTLIDAKAENALDRRDGLLDELRGLARDWPDDAAVREPLAMGLFNTLNHAKAENALDRRDGLLDELRGLARDWPDDAAVRQQLAMGLFNTLNDAKAENALDRRDGLLDELHGLARDWPDDAAVRQRLAMGLGFSALWASEKGDTATATAFTRELRGLAVRHPNDAEVVKIAGMFRKS